MAQAQVDGPGRSATRHRYFAQLPLLRACLHYSGVVGPNLPVDFVEFAAYGDFATGVLAMLALLTVRMRPLFWLFVVAFNLVGADDILIDYYHGIHLDLPALSGQLAATYWIPIIYVPALMITHFAAFYLLVRSRPERVLSLTGEAAAY
jgi:hypothetical protein